MPQHNSQLCLSITTANLNARRKCKTSFGVSGIRISMLVLAIGMVVASSTDRSDAQLFRKLGWSAPKPPPTVFDQVPTQQQMERHLQTRADLVRQLSSSVTVSIQGVRITGSLQVEFPNRMRLKAGFAGLNELGVDVGSNENQFWIWSRAPLPNQPPAFYFANHREYQQSAMRQSLPLDPNWLIEGLGLFRLEPSDSFHTLPVKDNGWLKFVILRQSGNGNQFRQILMDSQTGLIVQQAIYDAAENRIAYANTRDYKTQMLDGKPVSMPKHIDLFMTQPNGEDMKMAITLRSVSLDPLYGAPEAMWGMPDPGSVPKINLAQVSSLQPSTNQAGQQNYGRQPAASGVGFQRNR